MHSHVGSWQDQPREGQLHLDVLDEQNDLVILVPMAGVDPSSVDISVHGDLLTIKGNRQRPSEFQLIEEPYLQECFWGPFSRSLVLPVAVKSDLAEAAFYHGLLSIRIPKQGQSSNIPISVVEE